VEDVDEAKAVCRVLFTCSGDARGEIWVMSFLCMERRRERRKEAMEDRCTMILVNANEKKRTMEKDVNSFVVARTSPAIDIVRKSNK
jgi:hypothetical protein